MFLELEAGLIFTGDDLSLLPKVFFFYELIEKDLYLINALFLLVS